MTIKKLIAASVLTLCGFGSAQGQTLLDIAFVIDDTGSMGNEIAAIKAGATAFIDEVQADYDAQFGVVSFDDPASDTVLHINLTDDGAAVQTKLNTIVASGGGDCPEFAISGLRTAVNQMTWRTGSARVIFLVTDAGVKDTNIPFNNLTDMTQEANDANIVINTLVYISGCNYLDPIHPQLATDTGGESRVGLRAFIEGEDPLTVMREMLQTVIAALDTDGDAVSNDDDLCPDTEQGDSVDAVGCSDAQVDADGDGVCDPDAASGGPLECAGIDVCADTSIPEGVPTSGELNPNHWALIDGDMLFDTVTKGNGKGPGRSYTTGDTAGCSCEQIIEGLDLGNGHAKHGCSISAMDDWVGLME